MQKISSAWPEQFTLVIAITLKTKYGYPGTQQSYLFFQILQNTALREVVSYFNTSYHSLFQGVVLSLASLWRRQFLRPPYCYYRVQGTGI